MTTERPAELSVGLLLAGAAGLRAHQHATFTCDKSGEPAHRVTLSVRITYVRKTLQVFGSHIEAAGPSQLGKP